MENVGNTPATVYGTLHGPNATNQAESLGGNSVLPMGALSDDFHVYSVEWTAGRIQFLLDNTVYFTGTPAQFPGRGCSTSTRSTCDPQPGHRRELAREPQREHAVPRGAPGRLGARLRSGVAIGDLRGPPVP